MRKTILLKAEIPKGVSQADIVAYIITSLATWGGQFMPEDPLFHGIKVEKIAFVGNTYLGKKELTNVTS